MYETIFSATGSLAMLGWLALAVGPRFPFVVEVFARLLVPCAIALVYGWLMATHIGGAPAEGGFGSLASVKALFTVDGLLLAGWVHYLAFDLFVGSWEVQDARERGVPHLLVLPCLFATFMAGPVGLALYVLLRTVVLALRRQPSAEAAA